MAAQVTTFWADRDRRASTNGEFTDLFRLNLNSVLVRLTSDDLETIHHINKTSKTNLDGEVRKQRKRNYRVRIGM
jgi:hypothetical protein